MMRLGVLVPSPNTVLEPDSRLILPPNISMHTARMLLDGLSADAELRMLDDQLKGAVAALATTRPDLVVFACTSATALLGAEAEQDLLDFISRSCSAPAISANHAVRMVLTRADVSSVAVITPYPEDLTMAVCRGIEEDGIAVSAQRSMGLSDVHEIAMISVGEIVQWAIDAAQDSSTEAIFLSCTNLRAVEAARRLRELLDIPIITSNGALLAEAISAMEAAQ
ncbi:maleate cis-trans isomerase family protein [Microbacterium sp. LWH12-1.2]|uniref:maleate cis-trans isomerase family protein n=1 Tax=Microbacterium sp. LWH12-1.2 TaxID=3135259 RepID=UPI003440D44B